MAAPTRVGAPVKMLDLFSGSGGASRAAGVRGWDVVRIDNGEGTAADIRADLLTWEPPAGEPFDLVWASPPCTQLSTASQKRDTEAGLVLVRAALRIVAAVRPRWWVLENVHGATRAIGSLIGPPVATYGSFYLWGCFPPFAATVARGKTKLSGRRRAERRAAIPYAISEGLVRACEALARELGAGGLLGDRREAVGATSGGCASAGGDLEGAGAELERGELGGISGHRARVEPARLRA